MLPTTKAREIDIVLSEALGCLGCSGHDIDCAYYEKNTCPEVPKTLQQWVDEQKNIYANRAKQGYIPIKVK